MPPMAAGRSGDDLLSRDLVILTHLRQANVLLQRWELLGAHLLTAFTL